MILPLRKVRSQCRDDINMAEFVRIKGPMTIIAIYYYIIFFIFGTSHDSQFHPSYKMLFLKSQIQFITQTLILQLDLKNRKDYFNPSKNFTYLTKTNSLQNPYKTKQTNIGEHHHCTYNPSIIIVFIVPYIILDLLQIRTYRNKCRNSLCQYIQIQICLKLLIVYVILNEISLSQYFYIGSTSFSMRNRKIYKELQRIIETSLSPKRKPQIQKRFLYGPNVSLPSMNNLNTINQSKCVESLKASKTKVKMANTQSLKQSIALQIEQRRMMLRLPLTAWQIRQNSFLEQSQNTRVKDTENEPIGEIISKLCKVCLGLASKYGKNHIFLDIVMLEAKGRRKQAISKILTWLLGWIKCLFTVFSNIINKKIIDI